MLTLRQKITRPYVFIIISIPLTIIIIFNIIVAYYKITTAEEDLSAQVTQVAEHLQDSSMQIRDFMHLLRISPNSTNQIELIIYDTKGEFLRYLDTPDTFINQEIARLAYNSILNSSSGDMCIINYDNQKYYAMEVILTDSLGGKIIYITQGLIIDDFVWMVNIVLCLVSTFVMLVAIFVSNRVTTSITKPIENITALIENMNSFEVLTIDTKSDSIELQKLASEINLLNKRIYDFQKSQKLFLQNASHQLRTPLMSIQGYADGIEMGVFKDTKATAKLISNQAIKLTSLVNSLLSLARAENFKENQTFEVLNISVFLEELITELTPITNIDIISSIAEDVCCLANSELLNGSIGNILSNAIRYAKHQIHVTLNKQDANAIIIIKDDGDGVALEDDIFERFVKGEHGNFGLGLSIAKTAISALSGNISVTNDNGAVFTIIFPTNLSENT
ncbi:MAG: hypothetical protein BEN19_05795 [Epulopiscium sp. Nuni2H_MBin003]|nr:MAG: hypothetical protein BEN19_05795 [Epulopiscium sp. Nuni2H_MBin003]